jgi:hypothetical protein
MSSAEKRLSYMRERDNHGHRCEVKRRHTKVQREVERLDFRPWRPYLLLRSRRSRLCLEERKKGHSRCRIGADCEVSKCVCLELEVPLVARTVFCTSDDLDMINDLEEHCWTVYICIIPFYICVDLLVTCS